MDWDALGAIAETLGALGVVATLVSLACRITLDINQSRVSASHQGLGLNLYRICLRGESTCGINKLDIGKDFGSQLPNAVMR